VADGRRGSPMHRSRPRLPLLGATLLLLASGCTNDQIYPYNAHTDKVTLGAGNASAVNRAVHTIDPWPQYSQKTQIDTNGNRALVAVRRYETNTTVKPKGLSSEPAASNAAPEAQKN
jgi:hypothetical protein